MFASFLFVLLGDERRDASHPYPRQEKRDKREQCMPVCYVWEYRRFFAAPFRSPRRGWLFFLSASKGFLWWGVRARGGRKWENVRKHRAGYLMRAAIWTNTSREWICRATITRHVSRRAPARLRLLTPPHFTRYLTGARGTPAVLWAKRFSFTAIKPPRGTYTAAVVRST